ncbi:hypothetical protein C3489_10125 [Streptomyces sp. Ru71]|uniref:hypothetical protein n=1 Tax=Streptomyces sp. Ru71 TaxID=2080746 RepID=UPI000CDDC1D1|nr:hypothetical protein [Streptomyces sp. Ru71]POX55401.1 hypothetical protein C3489_10125 [Streptomyces sp. Ru71]
MGTAPDWNTGEGLIRLDDPAEVDAAFERGERHLGTAVIGLAFNCSLEEASPRILRAMRLPDIAQRGFAFTAAGVAARLNGALTPQLYDALRAEGLTGGVAEDAIRDTLTFVPFRELPWWFRGCRVWLGVRDRGEGWLLRMKDAVGDSARHAAAAWRRRSSRQSRQ